MLTNVNGIYTFSNIPAGFYKVREAVKPGWMQTGGQPVYTLLAVPGQPISGIDFGNDSIPRSTVISSTT